MKHSITVLRQLLPTAVNLDFLPPIIHDDGSIEYPRRDKDWEPPQTPEGYQVDPNNKWLFRPLWKECEGRLWGLRTKPCGQIELKAYCQHNDCRQFNSRVSYDTCSKCPLAGVRMSNNAPPEPKTIEEPKKPCTGCNDPSLPALPRLEVAIDSVAMQMPVMMSRPHFGREHPLAQIRFSLPMDTVQRFHPRPIFHPDGSIEYPKPEAASTPPDEIEGYKRANDNPWRFTPLWPDCVMRFQGAKLKENGCIQVHMICQNPEAAAFGKQVDCKTCTECPVRKTFTPPA